MENLHAAMKTQFSSVQLLSHVWLFATSWTAACQASLSITNSQSLLKLMSIESVKPSNHLILCCPLLLLPSIFLRTGSFQMSQFFASGGQSIGVSTSASVLPMNIQDWFPLGWTDWISLQSTGLSRVFSNTTVQKHQFSSIQPFYSQTLISIESVMPSNHLILCHGLFLLPSIFPSIRVFSSESVLHIRWSNYWSFSFNISPSNEHPGLISFRMDWLDLLQSKGLSKSLLQHHSLKASILRCSAL